MKRIVYLLIMSVFIIQVDAQVPVRRGYPTGRTRVVVHPQPHRQMMGQREVYDDYLFKPFNYPGTLYITPKIGYNIANMTNYDSNPCHGVNVGLAFEYMLSFQTSFEFGINYSMQGASYYVDSDDGLFGVFSSNRAVMRNNYINFPFVLKGYLMGGFHVFAGPQLGILASSNEHYNGGSDNLADDKNTVDLSLVLGAGYAGRSGFTISANYNIGMTRVFSGNYSRYYDDGFDYDNIRNSVFQINLGYRF